jgi:FkbM family methyltransferase
VAAPGGEFLSGRHVRSGLKTFLKQTRLAPVARRLRSLLRPDERLVVRRKNALYDAQTIEVMKRVLAEDSTAIDVGAHKGSILSEIVALAPKGRHFAFEPLPEFAATLRSRFPGVDVLECAVSDRTETTTFEFVRNAPAYSGLRRRGYDFPNPQIETVTVAADTLDNHIPRDLHVAFVKIDVEGGEYHAMLGGMATLQRCRPVIVFEAGANSTGSYGVTAADLFRLITQRLGLRLSTMDRWLRGRESYTERDFQANWGQPRGEFYFIAHR